jgi:hypothetical protein
MTDTIIRTDSVGFDYIFDPSPDNYQFEMIFKPLQRKPKNFRDECIETAKTIAAATTRPIMVAFSGGIDSEVVCRSFLLAGVDFTAVSFRYVSDGKVENGHDLYYAKKFCKQHDVKHLILDINMKDFFVNGVNKYIDQGYCTPRPFRYLMMHYIETIDRLGGTAVLCLGEQVYTRVDGILSHVHHAGYVNTLEWCKKNNRRHFTHFFLTTPEIIGAYLQNELIQFLLAKDKYFGNFNDVAAPEKILVYHSEFWGMETRLKFHGFENLIHERADALKRLQQKFPHMHDFVLHIDRLKDQLNIEQYLLPTP